jgi:hypothetical protein
MYPSPSRPPGGSGQNLPPAGCGRVFHRASDNARRRTGAPAAMEWSAAEDGLLQSVFVANESRTGPDRLTDAEIACVLSTAFGYVRTTGECLRRFVLNNAPRTTVPVVHSVPAASVAPVVPAASAASAAPVASVSAPTAPPESQAAPAQPATHPTIAPPLTPALSGPPAAFTPPAPADRVPATSPRADGRGAGRSDDAPALLSGEVSVNICPCQCRATRGTAGGVDVFVRKPADRLGASNWSKYANDVLQRLCDRHCGTNESVPRKRLARACWEKLSLDFKVVTGETRSLATCRQRLNSLCHSRVPGSRAAPNPVPAGDSDKPAAADTAPPPETLRGCDAGESPLRSTGGIPRRSQSPQLDSAGAVLAASDPAGEPLAQRAYRVGGSPPGVGTQCRAAAVAPPDHCGAQGVRWTAVEDRVLLEAVHEPVEADWEGVARLVTVASRILRTGDAVKARRRRLRALAPAREETEDIAGPPRGQAKEGAAPPGPAGVVAAAAADCAMDGTEIARAVSVVECGCAHDAPPSARACRRRLLQVGVGRKDPGNVFRSIGRRRARAGLHRGGTIAHADQAAFQDDEDPDGGEPRRVLREIPDHFGQLVQLVGHESSCLVDAVDGAPCAGGPRGRAAGGCDADVDMRAVESEGSDDDGSDDDGSDDDDDGDCAAMYTSVGGTFCVPEAGLITDWPAARPWWAH